MRKSATVKPLVEEPFTEQSVNQWNEALAKCEKAMRLCELGIQAGLPCQQDLTACTAVRDQLAAMKQVFAPGYT